MKEATGTERAAPHRVGASHPAHPASLRHPKKPDSPNSVAQGRGSSWAARREQGSKEFYRGTARGSSSISLGFPSLPCTKRSVVPSEQLSRTGTVGSPGRRKVSERWHRPCDPFLAEPGCSTCPSRRVRAEPRASSRETQLSGLTNISCFYLLEDFI